MGYLPVWHSNYHPLRAPGTPTGDRMVDVFARLTEVIQRHSVWLKGCGWERAKLRGLTLIHGREVIGMSAQVFRGVDLSCADMGSVYFVRIDMTDIDLSAANVSDAFLDSVDLTGADLRGASLSGARVIDCDLTGADLTGADLRYAVLARPRAAGANLNAADLTGASLSGDWRNANLRYANLTGADLRRADLAGADLTGARYDRPHQGGHGAALASIGSPYMWGASLVTRAQQPARSAA